ncbi:MAG: RNA-guided endonuclease InsQ/TnpB family protein [Candidatus Heimdallarchaeota archaeon]
MRRTNAFRLRPTKTQEQQLFRLAEGCSSLFNEVNYKRRLSFFAGNLDLTTDEFYQKYKNKIGSATAQQIIRKNSEAWRSFFALLKRWRKEKNKPKEQRRIKERPHPPGYWKNRQRKKKILRILIRNDCYRLDTRTLLLPLHLQIRWSGKNKWRGKQGRLEIIYDELKKKWYAYMPVAVQKEQLHQPKGSKKAYLDLGVKVPLMAYIEGVIEVIGYSGQQLLADWWYWTHRIAKHVSELKQTNGRNSSHQLRQLYQKRQRRFCQGINTMIRDFIQRCWMNGVAELVYGDLKDIRATAQFQKKSNTMIHNFWSHGYLMRRLKEKAEEYGIMVRLVNERGTSSRCPRCKSTRIIRKGRLFKCQACHLEAHRDAIGAINIGLAFTPVEGEVINRAVACPVLACIAS